MLIFGVPPKSSDSRNAMIMVLTVKYIRCMYIILFDGSKLTENSEEKCENCISEISIGWVRNRVVVPHNFWKSKFWLFIFKKIYVWGIFRPPNTFSLKLACIWYVYWVWAKTFKNWPIFERFLKILSKKWKKYVKIGTVFLINFV